MIQPACIKTWSTASEMQKSQREIWRSFENICILSFLNWVATVRNSGKIINFWQIGSGRCCVVHQGAAVSIIHKIICFTANKGDMGHQVISAIESNVANLVVIIHYQLTVVKWFLNYDSNSFQGERRNTGGAEVLSSRRNLRGRRSKGALHPWHIPQGVNCHHCYRKISFHTAFQVYPGLKKRP